MRRLAIAATLTVLVLTGCDAAEDTVRSAAGDAACSVADKAVDEAAERAGKAVDDIGADPQNAQKELRGIRNALATAEKGVDGDLKTKVTDARAAVDKLLGQAKDAAEGIDVDTTEVDDAKADLDSAIDDVKNIC